MTLEDFKTTLSTHSSFYEQLIEHLFISEVLQEMRFRFNQWPEVLKSEIDASGYDLVIESNKVIRHIQLKASYIGSKSNSVTLNTSLSEKPCGCAIRIEWLFNKQNRIEMKYYFFGNLPGQPLPDISTHPIGKHSKANSQGEKSERPATRTVKKAEFIRLNNITELVQQLFLAI
jgi:hypothetical protein